MDKYEINKGVEIDEVSFDAIEDYVISQDAIHAKATFDAGEAYRLSQN